MKKEDGPYSDKTDESLAMSYRLNGDKAYIGELFNRYGAIVYGICLKYLKNVPQSQDMTMHVFEKLMVQLKEKEVQTFRPWLHVVVRNECLMLLRKENKVRINSIDETYPPPEEENEIGFKLQTEAELEQLEQAIEQLKPEQRDCIKLFYLEDKCYQEIADSTGYSLKQVKSYIQNGKRNLKILLLESERFAEKNRSHE